MNKLNQVNCKQIDQQILQRVKDDNPEATEEKAFELFTCLKNKEQTQLIQMISKLLKLKEADIRTYIFGEYAQKFLYKLTEADKMMIKEITAQMKGEQYNKIFDTIMKEFANSDKQVHIESVKKSVHYYVKLSQKDDDKKK
ncbi:Hypothetical_protein [Hexamita inflata]|uniref:Hypothetical_protein n=1 Tax=Hexamita inflata TaxID=28002 RepID=A0AA86TX50_9EUKA|nr:Hypothetical protein HINF_LOCUS19859 [Hexamita inflata]CAI9961976.1 Hypothetical protein HINF_LOCUS49621 [Hexamita inflata]